VYVWNRLILFTTISGYCASRICMGPAVEENIKGLTHGDGTDVLSQNYDNQVPTYTE